MSTPEQFPSHKRISKDDSLSVVLEAQEIWALMAAVEEYVERFPIGSDGGNEDLVQVLMSAGSHLQAVFDLAPLTHKDTACYQHDLRLLNREELEKYAVQENSRFQAICARVGGLSSAVATITANRDRLRQKVALLEAENLILNSKIKEAKSKTPLVWFENETEKQKEAV